MVSCCLVAYKSTWHGLGNREQVLRCPGTGLPELLCLCAQQMFVKNVLCPFMESEQGGHSPCPRRASSLVKEKPIKGIHNKISDSSEHCEGNCVIWCCPEKWSGKASPRAGI